MKLFDTKFEILDHTGGSRFCGLAASVRFWLTESKPHRIGVNKSEDLVYLHNELYLNKK
jgi:hypothetical protein